MVGGRETDQCGSLGLKKSAEQNRLIGSAPGVVEVNDVLKHFFADGIAFAGRLNNREAIDEKNTCGVPPF